MSKYLVEPVEMTTANNYTMYHFFIPESETLSWNDFATLFGTVAELSLIIITPVIMNKLLICAPLPRGNLVSTYHNILSAL